MAFWKQTFKRQRWNFTKEYRPWKNHKSWSLLIDSSCISLAALTASSIVRVRFLWSLCTCTQPIPIRRMQVGGEFQRLVGTRVETYYAPVAGSSNSPPHESGSNMLLLRPFRPVILWLESARRATLHWRQGTRNLKSWVFAYKIVSKLCTSRKLGFFRVLKIANCIVLQVSSVSFNLSLFFALCIKHTHG